MELEEWAEKRIQSIQAHVNRVIQFHPQKCRYTLDARMKDNDSVIIKLNNIEKTKHARLLNKEGDYYRNHQDCSYLPRLICVENGLLITENVQGKTLLDFIEKGGDLPVNELFQILTEMRKSPIDGINAKLFVDYVFYRLELFLNSGYFNRRDTLNSCLKKIEIMLWRFLKKTMLYRLRVISKMIPLQCVHGDLHLNNILINEKRKLYVIDWENYGAGVFLMDCAALYGQIAVLVNMRQKQDVLEVMRSIFIENDTEQYFVRLALICEALATLNPRYSAEGKKGKAFFANIINLIKTVFLFNLSRRS